MKFGVVSYEKKYLNLDGADKQNLGDWIQMLAMEYLYREWGIRDYLRVSRNTAANYTGETVIVPWNGVLFDMNCNRQWHETFPFSNKIIPVFFSMYYHGVYMRESTIAHFSKFAPIGCRDEVTMELMHENGIPAYISGCVTALFPKRSENIVMQNKVLLVDAPKGIEDYMPEHLRKKIVYGTNLYPVKRLEGEHYMTVEESDAAYNCAKENLRFWCNNAKLVVTSRLHVAIPCVAMGIPVVLVKKQFDKRFSWVEKLLHPYSYFEWEYIDWNPQPIEYEEEKKRLKELLYKRLMQAYHGVKEETGVCTIFEQRERVPYSYLMKKALLNMGIENSLFENKKFAIWGVTAETIYVIRTLREICPSMELVKAYDNYVEGTIEGCQIEKSCCITKENNLIYFVFAKSVRQEAAELFEKNQSKYVFVEIDSECWEYHF